MAGKINFLGHPVHPMLIAFPLGLLPVAVLFDIIFLCTSNAQWAIISYWLIAVGVISGLLAAVFGAADWWALGNGTRAKRIGLLHGLINVVVTALFAISWVMRRPSPAAPNLAAIIIGIIALVLALVAAWLGGELVYRLSVGVDFDAHVNSPSSLSDRPAKEQAR
ncbi:MAG: hypothetical protein DLM52_00900 [Chthoniobacterales bacterium]|nr:MAG: hypothetical protein DLM52_00900 [Chthoniobacterales bacterium]